MNTIFPLTKLFVRMDLRNRSFMVPSFIFPPLMMVLMSIIGKSGGARGDISYASYLTPGILCMAYASVALVGLPVMITSYREKGILRLFKSSKIPMIKVACSIFLTQLFFMVLQTFMVLLFSIFFLRAKFSITSTSYLAIPVFIVGLLALLSVGFLFSAFFKNTRAATMTGNLLNLLFIFLGGVFWPASSWPKYIQPLTWINPLTWTIDALRKSFLWASMNFDDFLVEFFSVSAILVFFTLLGIRLFKYE